MRDIAEKDFLTVKEVMQILRMKKTACYNLLGSPDCPFQVVRFGKLIRVPLNSFSKWYGSLEERKSIH